MSDLHRGTLHLLTPSSEEPQQNIQTPRRVQHPLNDALCLQPDVAFQRRSLSSPRAARRNAESSCINTAGAAHTGAGQPFSLSRTSGRNTLPEVGPDRMGAPSHPTRALILLQLCGRCSQALLGAFCKSFVFEKKKKKHKKVIFLN